MATETYTIAKRLHWLTSISVEIDCAPDAPPRVKLGLAVQAAVLRGADLRDTVLTGADLRDADLTSADLTGAVLTGAVLRDADLRDADLTGADLTGADLRGADLRDTVLRGAPKIENIHQTVYAAASAPGALDMSIWHNSCGTAHCRAGWVVALAGDEGRALEERLASTARAATLIYLASDPTLDRAPDFYCDNIAALADMRRLAEAEAAASDGVPVEAGA